jgi:hypothetical protein
MSSDNDSKIVPLTSISSEFKDQLQMQLHIQAQHNTITNLLKQIESLKDEKNHLESLLTHHSSSLTINNPLNIDDEETICRMQLKRLRDKSLNTELTLEEAKRVEIYTKILNTKLNQPKTVVVKSNNISNDDLLAAFETVKELESGSKDTN